MARGGLSDDHGTEPSDCLETILDGPSVVEPVDPTVVAVGETDSDADSPVYSSVRLPIDLLAISSTNWSENLAGKDRIRIRFESNRLLQGGTFDASPESIVEFLE